MAWPVEVVREEASTLHERPWSHPVRRAVWVCEPTRRALVVGSAQSDDVVDRVRCDDAGVDVVRRHSGGGAVLVEPGRMLWVDVLLPSLDPLWEPDVGRAFLWLGEVWARALAELGIAAMVHRGPLVRTRWSDLVCFAGLGSGELTDAAGRKVLGISQRRTRAGARFQCMVPGDGDVSSLLHLLALSPDERAAAEADLHGVVAGVGDDLGPLLDAFLHHLP